MDYNTIKNTAVIYVNTAKSLLFLATKYGIITINLN